MRIGILIIATNRYNDFVQPLVTSADQHLLCGRDVTYFVFTNEDIQIESERQVVVNRVEHRSWPWMTLGRYSIFEDHASNLEGMDYLFYTDADMLFVGPVGDEILSERVATQHPGYAGRRGTPETRPESSACVHDHESMQYFAGGFNGGSTTEYLRMCATISSRINSDYERGVIAVWHDESHLNRYLIDNTPTKILDPTYCWPEQVARPTGAKLLALEKNHNAIRS